jgi:hypothetical protein
MTGVFIAIVAVVFFALLFFLVFPQGKKLLRDSGPKSTEPTDPNNSNWKMPKN